MEEINEFERFDVVTDDSDHHFLGSNKGKCFTDIKSGVYRAIIREWKILQKNLPEMIYVRVYERRIDLMRAVIIGATGTPYHDSLFFFDIAFPSDYPNHPPKVHYHSFGYIVNPNLLRNGRVCLSLLNTWPGKKTEMWDPRGSTMLQVLISIQALVLNENPFYNENPFNNEPLRLFGSESMSRACNEHVFVITCHTSFSQLQKPPRNFEAFVRGHFRERAFSILAACNEYVHGRVRVGYYSSQLCFSGSDSTVHVSLYFKERMVQFYPRLFQAFRQNGASLEGMVEHLEVEVDICEQCKNKRREQMEKSKKKKKSSGIFKKIMEKIEKALGRKKSRRKQESSKIEGRNGSFPTA